MKKSVLLAALLLSVSVYGTNRNVSVDIGHVYQQIEGFGASDCWTAQFVGRYWSEEEKAKAAKWLFSSAEDKTGQPEGIGLSIWRFNVGGGTEEQGAASGLKLDRTRRAECFLNADGSYDWNKQAGQQWFLRQAKHYGCRNFVAFSNTPPVFYTRNGKGYAPKDGNANLKAEHYADFARFLVDVVEHFKKKGIRFNYLSPVNEPQWNWAASYQEGSPWQNEEIYRLLCATDSVLNEHKISTQLLITEAGSWDNLYMKKERASNQIDVFFNPKSPLYVGGLKHIPHLMGAHSYWTDKTDSTLQNVRRAVRQKADEFALPLHQTEWSLLNTAPLDGLPDYHTASYMDIALFMSKVIYADMVYAGVESWSFWTSMDIEAHGFKNRFNLLRLAPKGGQIDSIVRGGKVMPMKTLWVLGNYSRFIRPGYKRVDLTGADALNGMFASAYVDKKRKRLVIVGSNMGMTEERLDVKIEDKGKKVDATLSGIYLTDKTHNLSVCDLRGNGLLRTQMITVPPRSVVTVIYKLS